MKAVLSLGILSFLTVFSIVSVQAKSDSWCESALLHTINDEKTGYLSFFTPEQREFFAEIECGYKITTLARDPYQTIEEVVMVFKLDAQKACILDDGIADGSADHPYLVVPCRE